MTLDPDTVAVLDALIAEKRSPLAWWKRRRNAGVVECLKRLRAHVLQTLRDSPPATRFKFVTEVRGTGDQGFEIIARNALVWLPQPHTTFLNIEIEPSGRVMAELEIPEWLAKEKELL